MWIFYASDDEVTAIFQADVVDDVMRNAELVEELDHAVGIPTKIGNVRL